MSPYLGALTAIPDQVVLAGEDDAVVDFVVVAAASYEMVEHSDRPDFVVQAPAALRYCGDDGELVGCALRSFHEGRCYTD